MARLCLNAYYLPEFGISDAVGELMGLNRYSYANNNPVNLTDPSGMIAERPEQWSSCRQNSESCSQCIEGYLSFVAPYGGRELWGFSHEAAMRYCSQQCQPPTGTPRPTPLPTNTPYPEATVQLPMDLARLSNCDFEARVNGGIPSRDANPPGYPVESPVYAPVNSTVWLVDTDGNNEGLGNIVVLRIAVQDLPASIQRNMPSTTGYLYLMYAHLSTVVVSQIDAQPLQTVSMGNIVGYSGNSGIGGEIHLDITVFYNSLERDPIAQLRLTYNDDKFQRYNRLGPTAPGNPFGSILVDPIDLWPKINEDLQSGAPICPTS